MSILFHHYKEPKKCIKQVEQLDARVNNSNKTRLTIEKEEKEEEEEQDLSSSSRPRRQLK
jgi:hypothetical protein